MGWSKVTSFSTGPSTYLDAEKFYAQHAFLGRWFYQSIGNYNVLTTINQGSEIRAQVKGTANITANFYLDSNSSYVPYIAYSVDGAAFTRAPIAASTGSGQVSVSLATGLNASAAHTVKIVASGIKETDPVWLQGAGLHFMGLTVDSGARVTPWNSGNKRILFLGDSITAGINLLGTGAVPQYNAGEQNFSHLCASNVGADPIQVGFGATGVTKGGNGGVPDAASSFPYFMSGRNLSEPVPDVIVVNHGTNDSGAVAATFQTDYQNYINSIQSTYPNVPVFCMRPFNGSQAAGVQAVATGTANCHYVDTSSWSITTTDGTHPDASGSQTAATNLASALTSVLGAGFFN